MEQLGIESSLLLAQIVNFLIILFVLTKLLYKPIIAMLDKRKKEIGEGLEITQRMRLEEEKLDQKKVKLLDAARKEAQGIIASSRVQAKEIEKEILAEAQKEAYDVLEKGKVEVVRLKESMEKEIRAGAIDLAVVMAKKLLDVSLSTKEKREISQKHIRELETMKL